jgi:hypothetical protein
MNLPNLDGVEIPKRILAGITTIYFLKDITDFRMALLAYIFVAYCIGCQTLTDVRGKKFDLSHQRSMPKPTS